MNRRVHERVQAQCTAALEEFAPAKEVVERGTSERQYQQCNGVPPGALFQRLDRVGSQMVVEQVDQQAHKGRPAIDMDGNLQRGVAFEEGCHSVALGGVLAAEDGGGRISLVS